MRIVEAVTGSQLAIARSLIEEYAAALPIDLSFQDFQEELARFPGEYSPPSGAVLLAYVGKEPAGVVALRRHGPSGCEMKRLYVLPRFRGRGVGRALSKKVIRKAADLGYATMRLDTLASMDAAIALYRAFGFHEIPAYRYNPVAGAKFMELVLSPR
jgi:ribosomal protein S18 acetylase RimI-like enzyme